MEKTKIVSFVSSQMEKNENRTIFFFFTKKKIDRYSFSLQVEKTRIEWRKNTLTQRRLRLQVARRLVTSTIQENEPEICRKRLRTESDFEAEISEKSKLGSVSTLQSLEVELSGSEGSGSLVAEKSEESSASQ